MAKTNNVKKEFSWDSEVLVKEIVVNEFEKRTVSITALNGVEYVCVATHKKIKGDWKPVKNATFPKAIWGDIVDAVSDFDLKSAFGSTTNLQAPGKAQKAPKAAKSEKAKKEPVATLQGVKPSILDKLQRNTNWAHLTKAQQEKLVKQVQAIHEEYGMVSVGITRTSTTVAWGKNQQAGEQEIKKMKGFSRAQITFIA